MPSMPQPVQHNQDDSTAEEIVLGVDTHKDVHVAAVLSTLGVILSRTNFPATAAGYRALLAWVGTFGVLRRAGVECTGSYGAALARHLRAAGVEVIEVNPPDKATRRRVDKTDTIDAQAAVRAILNGRATGSAKAGNGPVEMLRMFKLAKASAVKARTQTINQLKAVLVAADPALREALSDLTSIMLIRRCAQLETTTPHDVTSAAVYNPAVAGSAHPAAGRRNRRPGPTITDTITLHCPTLLTRRGIGPDNAAALLIAAGDNPGRLRSETSFAALCGVNPLEASSGKTSRRRLNRGGDRQANSALYRIALSRLRWDPRTRDYLARRTTEGKTRAKPSAASSDTSPARSTRSSRPHRKLSRQGLDIHRGIKAGCHAGLLVGRRGELIQLA